MPKRGARLPWRVTFQHAGQGKPTRRALHSSEEAAIYADEIRRAAALRGSTVKITIENRDQGETMTKADVNTDEGAQVLDQISANIERARSLAINGEEDALKALEDETETLISSLTGKNSIKAKKEKRDAWAAAVAEAKEQRAEVATLPKEGVVTAKSWDQYEGVQELVTLGAEKIAEGVRAHIKTSHLAKDVAAVIFDMWTRLPNKDDNPDLRGDSDNAKKATRRLVELAGEGFEHNYDNEDALTKLMRSVQTQRTDVRAAWLRSLDEDGEDAAERRALIAGVLAKKPDDVPASEFAAAYYRVGLKGEIEKARERYQLQQSGKGSDDDTGAPQKSPDELVTDIVKKLNKDVGDLDVSAFENASQEVKDAARATLEAQIKRLREMVAATL